MTVYSSVSSKAVGLAHQREPHVAEYPSPILLPWLYTERKNPRHSERSSSEEKTSGIGSSHVDITRHRGKSD
jgi:hypothetical protein